MHGEWVVVRVQESREHTDREARGEGWRDGEMEG